MNQRIADEENTCEFVNFIKKTLPELKWISFLQELAQQVDYPIRIFIEEISDSLLTLYLTIKRTTKEGDILHCPCFPLLT
jgi:hypothetical protein